MHNYLKYNNDYNIEVPMLFYHKYTIVAYCIALKMPRFVFKYLINFPNEYYPLKFRFYLIN